MRLSIYISNHCANCAEAVRIADEARRIPSLQVDVINLDATTASVPGNVFAVPTYLLDGAVVSLGNPRAEEFLGGLRGWIERGEA